jgi:hypothetical protein
MKTILWLDDLRNPFTEPNWVNFKQPNDIVIWVKNYNEFVDYISKNGLPDLISFDHDLGETDELTGYDCSKWLVDYLIDNKLKLPQIRLHTANPVGAKNIEFTFKNFLKYYGNY